MPHSPPSLYPQYQRMRALEAEFAADLKALEDEFETERTEIVNAHTRQRKVCREAQRCAMRADKQWESEGRYALLRCSHPNRLTTGVCRS